jgi:hypothetical protein
VIDESFLIFGAVGAAVDGSELAIFSLMSLTAFKAIPISSFDFPAVNAGELE